MTLVIAAHGADFIILGTDSQGTIQASEGTRVEINVMRKLIPVAKHVAILLYGDVNEGNNLVEKFKLSLTRRVDGVTEVANAFADFCIREVKKIKDVPRIYLPDCGFIIAGLDRKRRKYLIPRCYSLRSASGFWLGLYQQEYAIEGKPMIVYYIFAKEYQRNMQLNGLCRLVAQALYDTVNIDGDVGGKIIIAVIESDGLREIPQRDIKHLVSAWGTITT